MRCAAGAAHLSNRASQKPRGGPGLNRELGKMMMRHLPFETRWLFAFALAVIGCGSDQSASTKTPSADRGGSDGATTNDERTKKIDEVELALNWLPEAEHGGFFAA